jgi:hypothetical protein
MRIYFSGDNNEAIIPEVLLARRQPHVMLSFYSVYRKLRGRMVARRLTKWLRNKNENQKRNVP